MPGGFWVLGAVLTGRWSRVLGPPLLGPMCPGKGGFLIQPPWGRGVLGGGALDELALNDPFPVRNRILRRRAQNSIA